MIKESKYCSDGMKKHFNKELVMTKEEENDNFENSTKCCDKDYIDGDVKEIIVISLQNIEVQHIKIVISMLN